MFGTKRQLLLLQLAYYNYSSTLLMYVMLFGVSLNVV